jgi:hypothetical protein
VSSIRFMTSFSVLIVGHFPSVYVSSTDLVNRLHIHISTETCCIPIGDFCLLIHVGGYVFVIGLQDLSEFSEEETAFKKIGRKPPS